MSQKAVLFVCLGNICRSPLAEAALRAQAVANGLALTIDSAGTSALHAGNPADPRAIAEAARHGIDLSAHRARQVTVQDFMQFGRIYALDQRNLIDLKALAPNRPLATTTLLMDSVPGRRGTAVIDPWYGTAADFATVWEDVALAAQYILADLQR
jgi:protein-tyrosine phosphatase